MAGGAAGNIPASAGSPGWRGVADLILPLLQWHERLRLRRTLFPRTQSYLDIGPMTIEVTISERALESMVLAACEAYVFGKDDDREMHA